MPKQPTKPAPKKPAAKSAPSRAIIPAAKPIVESFNGTFTQSQIDLVNRTICKGASDDELQLFLAVCQRTGLDPFQRQIYSIARKAKDEKGNWTEVRSIQTGIDGFRLIADRTKEVDGQDGPYWCDKDGVWKEVWLSSDLSPVAAKVVVWRKGVSRPFVGVARFDAYAQFYKDGGTWKLTSMWLRMGDVMIAKCAEALALRKAFPLQLGELRTLEEMAQADNPPEDPERNANAKVIEAGGTVESFTPEKEKEKPVVNDTLKATWRDYKFEGFATDSPFFGKTMGEVHPSCIHFLKNRYKWKATQKEMRAAFEEAIQDPALVAAFEHYETHKEWPKTAQEAAKPEKATVTPETVQKGSAGQQGGKKSTPKASKAADWRGVTLNLEKSKALHGRKLGDIAKAGMGDISYDGASDKQKDAMKNSDGLHWIRTLVVQGIPALGDDTAQIEAIKAAAKEIKAFDDPAWLKILKAPELRAEVIRRLNDHGMTEEKAQVIMKDITRGTPLAKLEEGLLRYIIQEWGKIETLIEAEKDALP